MKNIPIGKKALALHKKYKGKIETASKVPVRNRDDLSLVYTPGVGTVASYLAQHPNETPKYTLKGTTVAVISDGSAVLGLGNIGPEGALPVMEGKALIFKEFAGVNAVPIVLGTQDTDEIVETIVRIAPAFGGINLEDISAPRCFEIEEKLKARLPIPVMHDDQHGTAIVVLAALINAFKVTGKQIKKGRVVIVGAGAAGSALAKLFTLYGIKDVILVDSKGIIENGRTDLPPYKKELALITNPRKISGGIREALTGADALIGVSGPNLLKKEDVALMSEKPIVFAMANPIPEIMPEEAKKGGAYIIATGRSDFPNQVNNSLVFPGVFRGALDNKVRTITDKMKLHAAQALARLVAKPTTERIIPDMFDKRAVKAVASSIR